MPRDYSHVSIYTAMAYLELGADNPNPGEREAAKAIDDAEPETDKAWRHILQGHFSISLHIFNMRRALHDMGAGLSPRATREVQAWIAQNGRWRDPHPEKSLRDAMKLMADCLADMPSRWKRLRKAEEKRDADLRKSGASLVGRKRSGATVVDQIHQPEKAAEGEAHEKQTAPEED